MAPRNETKDAGNGSDEPKAEKGYATLATLRYAPSPTQRDAAKCNLQKHANTVE
jgi:hypothetical protein